ncbi:hypothetical protein BDV28DRAFT_142860 [Aspergillus coremiiformis]|uniref:Uncharacterized protein n=1 Tax=Aspergillus coremiiformis TaxID=138285 RepID=A0A5N6YYH9_9EURO|nr:hypothetical protein BDV28DRAFT_142860 [Aspergillus coremiiformis]
MDAVRYLMGNKLFCGAFVSSAIVAMTFLLPDWLAFVGLSIAVRGWGRKGFFRFTLLTLRSTDGVENVDLLFEQTPRCPYLLCWGKSLLRME